MVEDVGMDLMERKTHTEANPVAEPWLLTPADSLALGDDRDERPIRGRSHVRAVGLPQLRDEPPVLMQTTDKRQNDESYEKHERHVRLCKQRMGGGPNGYS